MQLSCWELCMHFHITISLNISVSHCKLYQIELCEKIWNRCTIRHQKRAAPIISIDIVYGRISIDSVFKKCTTKGKDLVGIQQEQYKKRTANMRLLYLELMRCEKFHSKNAVHILWMLCIFGVKWQRNICIPMTKNLPEQNELTPCRLHMTEWCYRQRQQGEE